MAKMFVGVMGKDYLSLDNEEAYTPTGPYNPATKVYVDDHGLNGGDIQSSPSDDGRTPSTVESDETIDARTAAMQAAGTRVTN